MDALIAEVAVAGVPEPVPVIFEAKRVKRAHGRGTKEDVPLHSRRYRLVVGMADRRSASLNNHVTDI